MSEIANMVEFMKTQTRKNLIEANNQGKIDLSEDQIKKVCFYIDASIGNAFTRAASQIEKKVT
jgi:hypothetical protein